MKKNEPYEGRMGISASLSLKQPFTISIEKETHQFFRAKEIELPGWTELFKKFLISKTGLSEKDFDEMVINFVKEKAKIKGRGELSREFRKFLAEEILKQTNIRKGLKERWRRYEDEKEYL